MYTVYIYDEKRVLRQTFEGVTWLKAQELQEEWVKVEGYVVAIVKQAGGVRFVPLS